MNSNKPIYVTQPTLPPLEEFLPYLQQIWDSKILTNGGPFHQQLEQALCDYLGVKHIALFTNGTIALSHGSAKRYASQAKSSPHRIPLWRLPTPCCGTVSSRCSWTLIQ